VLEGITVVQLGASTAARYTAKLLLQLGAEVLVASRGAETAPAESPDARTRRTAMALFLDGGKVDRAMTLDEVAACADVVIRDDTWDLFATSPAEELAALHAVNAAAVYAVLSPFGASGPWAGRSGDDLAIQAAGALSSQIGRPGEKPLSVPYEVGAITQGLHAAGAVMYALLLDPAYRPDAPIDVAGSDALASYTRMYTHIYTFYGAPAVRAGRRAPGSGGQYPMTILPCADGHVVMMSRSRDEWRRYLDMMGSPAWSSDPELQDPALIARHHADRMDELMSEWLSTRTRADLATLAQEYGVALAPLRDLSQVLADDQLAYREFFQESPTASLRLPTFPARFTSSRPEEAT
jgi:crotonobetainyl-CoA:carnitine CoA-transferase CaiB-like acyl-CoA transferase